MLLRDEAPDEESEALEPMKEAEIDRFAALDSSRGTLLDDEE